MQWNFNSCEQCFCPCILFNREMSSSKNKALLKLNVWAKLMGKSKIIVDLFCLQDLPSSPIRSLGPTSKLLCNRSRLQHVCLFVCLCWNLSCGISNLFKQSFSNLKAPLQHVETSIDGTCLVEYQIFSNPDKKTKVSCFCFVDYLTSQG